MHFSDLIQPMEKAVFFEQYWEQKPLYLNRNDPKHFGGLFSLKDLDKLLGYMPDAAKIKLAMSTGDKDSPAKFGKTGMNNLGEIYQAFDQGFSVIVDSMHLLWDPVAKLNWNLVQELGIQTQFNMYITPPGATGFNCHWDDHDVMILQLEGEKEWHLFDFGPDLPRAHVRPDNMEIFDPGEPSRILVMQPGDFLYLPRGTLHQAISQDATSVHLTMGLLIRSWEHLVVAALSQLAKKHLPIRKALPPGWFSDPKMVAEMAANLAEPLEELLSEENLRHAADHVADEIIAELAPPPDDHFNQLPLINKLALDTPVARRAGNLSQILSHNERIMLRFPGGFQSGPIKLNWAFQFLQENERFTPGEIPGWFSEEEKLRLVKHLLRKGYLRICQSAAAEA